MPEASGSNKSTGHGEPGTRLSGVTQNVSQAPENGLGGSRAEATGVCQAQETQGSQETGSQEDLGRSKPRTLLTPEL